MEEAGLDLSKEFTKPLTADAVEVPDVVVTMVAGTPVRSSMASGTSTES
jgi:protein-tyrosine-phosphatase